MHPGFALNFLTWSRASTFESQTNVLSSLTGRRSITSLTDTGVTLEEPRHVCGLELRGEAGCRSRGRGRFQPTLGTCYQPVHHPDLPLLPPRARHWGGERFLGNHAHVIPQWRTTPEKPHGCGGWTETPSDCLSNRRCCRPHKRPRVEVDFRTWWFHHPMHNVGAARVAQWFGAHA